MADRRTPAPAQPHRVFGTPVQREGLSPIPAAHYEYVIYNSEGASVGTIGTDLAGGVIYAEEPVGWAMSKDMYYLKYYCNHEGMRIEKVYPPPEPVPVPEGDAPFNEDNLTLGPRP